MNTAIFVGLVAILFAFLEDKHVLNKGLIFAFLALTVFLSIRYDWGNDYLSYLKGFNEIGLYYSSISDLFSPNAFLRYEIGWHLLCILFKHIGFFAMVMVVTIVENVLLYFFIRRYCPQGWYWLALFVYVFTPNLFFTCASAMRQMLAICIVLTSFQFIEAKKPVSFILLILLATSFHKSAILLLPIYFLGILSQKDFKEGTLMLIIPITILWYYLAPSFLDSNIDFLLNLEDFESYNQYADEQRNVSFSIIGLLSTFTIPFVSIMCLNKAIWRDRILLYLSFLSVLVIPLSGVMMMMIREQFYFQAFSIVAIPICLNEISGKYKMLLWGLVLFYVATALRGFSSFISDPLWEPFINYQTIFSVNWQ